MGHRKRMIYPLHPTCHALGDAVDRAMEDFDGHLTIYRFTTGWKVCFGTPSDPKEMRAALNRIPGSLTLEQALQEALGSVPCFYDGKSEWTTFFEEFDGTGDVQ